VSRAPYRTSRAALALAGVAAVAVGVAPRDAHADSGALLGETSRAAALGTAVTAQHADTSAIFYNPGALGDLTRARVSLHAHLGRSSLWYQRPGEDEVPVERTLAGFTGAIAAPLFGPEWLRAFRVGLAFHVPAQHALRLIAPSRPDEPSFPLYGDRAERTALTGALALRLFDRLGIGTGVTLSPSLQTPTVVRYDAARSDDVDENVLVDLERELDIGASALFGVRAQVLDELALGVAYRQKITTRAFGPNDTVAGSLVVRDQIDFYDFLAPDELALGVAVFPFEGASASVDVVRAQWSAYRTIHNEAPRPGFDDVFDVRAGVEWAPRPFVPLRLGYAFEPTPVPEQTGETNLIDADRHVLSLGAGLSLDALDVAPLSFDAHFRTHLLATQESTKDVSSLPDDDPQTRGKQVSNFGYPAISGSGTVWQVGLSATYWFGRREPVDGAEATP
jgi:hypothetical protein